MRVNNGQATYDGKTLIHLRRSPGRWTRACAAVTPDSQNLLHTCQPSLFVGSPVPRFQLRTNQRKPDIPPKLRCLTSALCQQPPVRTYVKVPCSPLPWQPLSICQTQVIMTASLTIASSVHSQVCFFFLFTSTPSLVFQRLLSPFLLLDRSFSLPCVGTLHLSFEYQLRCHEWQQ